METKMKTKAQLMLEIEDLTIKLKASIARENSLRRRLSLAHAARAPWTPRKPQEPVQKELNV